MSKNADSLEVSEIPKFTEKLIQSNLPIRICYGLVDLIRKVEAFIRSSSFSRIPDLSGSLFPYIEA
jgi:hypothetical protein